ncbi:N-acetylneuraminate synthase family protein [Marinobacterium aestuariivivens]|uniref:N-acetylneuraminate synthase family protein n=1 Tax=Marinobacterium aestuariivivens TaxID=1698799 RepID=A0ABW1ZYR7_9GAMM
MKQSTFIIAEIGQAHDGSLGILHSYIDAVAQTGVDAIKFQTHIAEAESSALEPFRVKFSYVDSTRYDYWQRMSFSAAQWREIREHCDTVGLEFMSSPFSNAAVDLLEAVGIKRYKVGSGEVTNFLMLERLSQTGKPVILSSGMSSYAELDAAVSYLQERGTEVSVMQCTTSYPTPAERLGLNVIDGLKQRYGLPTGLSDHSGTPYPAIAAAALGAELVEVHAVFDKRMFGPDSRSSLTLDQLAQMVEGIRMVDTAAQHPIDKDDLAPYRELKGMFEKSLSVNKDLPAGHRLRFEDLEAKKPAGQGMAARDWQQVIGQPLKRPLSQWAFLNSEDLDNA